MDDNATAVDKVDDSLKQTADKCAAIAVNQVRTGIKFRQERLDNIMKSEELYFNRKSKALRGRFNFPLPIMSGFVDTLMSKIDDEPNINFTHVEEADKLRAKKVTASWKFDSAPTRGAWAIKDLLVKKLAIFSGRGIYKIFSESSPTYKNYFEIVDAFDFIAEPGGGWHLENHLFCGQQNVFRSKAQLDKGVEEGRYDKAQVEKLVATSSNAKDQRTNQDLYRNRQRRFEALGLDIETNNYVGQLIFNLTEWQMEYEGTRYYMLFDEVSGIWIRFGTHKDIIGSDKLMWKSWATHYDAWNFWSKAPVDDIRPVAEALKVVVNFMFDDSQKRLWGQTLYDPEMITDPSQLEWDRPDKLVQVYVPSGKKLADGVYQVPMGDKSSVTINLLDYFRNFMALESGVTNDSKGQSNQQTLGIAQINMGETADRFGLYNKFYRQCWAELGEAYFEGLMEHMTEPRLIRMIGEHGIGWKPWQEMSQKDLKFESTPDISITGGTSQAKLDAEKSAKKEAALDKVVAFAPELLNKKVTSETYLLNGEFSDDEITALFDVSSDGNEEESVRASQAIQDILENKMTKIYKGATTRFMRKILTFAKMEDVTDKQRIALNRYAELHIQIVQDNMEQKGNLQASAMNRAALAGGAAGGGSIVSPYAKSAVPNQETPAAETPQEETQENNNPAQ